MSEWKEYVAKTTSEALTNAQIDLETTSDNIEYEILEKEKSGFLGIGSKLAKIRARVKEKQETEAILEDEKPVAEEKAKPAVPASKPKKEKSSNYNDTKKSPDKSTAAAEKREASASVRKLTDEEAEDIMAVAKSFMDKLFDAMHMQVAYDVNFDMDNNSLSIDLSGDEMGILIGKRGQTLDSLQYLISLVVNKKYEGYIKIKLDTENYRQRRRETLENLAVNISHRVKRTKHSVTLEPMNPYERRIIHSALQHDKYVETHSEGDEPYRKVVVTLKKEYMDYYGGSSNRNSRGRYSGGYNRNYNKRRYNNNHSYNNEKESEETEND